jgi:hypothetical protein
MVSFYFAWCGPGEPFSAAHMREDEIVLSFDLAHLEGQIPTLSVEIKNPRIGLLAPGRLQWVWFSWQSPTGAVTPLFYGRLVALPSNLFNEVVTLTFLARPTNYLAQKQAAAEALKVSPYYDPIWIAQDKWDDPDTILESYTTAWHVDRTSLTITTSDMIFGEDGTAEFLPEDSFYDSVSLSFAQSPQSQVQFTGTVNWTQTGGGIVKLPDVSPPLFYNGDQWVSDWPKPGASLQGGWCVADSALVDLWGTGNAYTYNVTGSYQNHEKTHRNGDQMSVSISRTYAMPGNLLESSYITSDTGTRVIGDPDTGTAASASESVSYIQPMLFALKGSLTLAYGLNGKRTETVTFTMNSALQSIVTTPADEAANPIALSMQGSDVGVSLQGVVPIGDPGRNVFFPTDRGIQALQYPLLVARAHLLQSARAVKIGFDCQFERAISLSCRKNALLHDSRLPGGQALGKITEYHIKGSGDQGQLIGTVQIESTIGAGGSVTVVEGTPVYADDGYVAVGYQLYDGGTLTLPTYDLAFTLPGGAGVGPPIGNDAVIRYEIMHGLTPEDAAKNVVPPPSMSDIAELAAEQQVQSAQDKQKIMENQIQDQVKNNPTWLDLELAPVAGFDYAAEYPIQVGTLIIPRMIDLEAPSA